MLYEKVVAIFDTSEHAQTAVDALKASGFSADDISVVSNETLDRNEAKVATASGFWRRLFGGDVDLHEAKVYGTTVGKGGSVVTVRAPDNLVDKAVGILQSHGPVDVNQRATTLGILAAGAAPIAGSQTAAKAVATVASTVQDAASAPKDKEVTSLSAEQPETRVRRFVIEKAVEAQVTLHEEHASVARRAITDQNYIGNVDWSERTIEIVETAEQPVVTKSAHIVEEVVIGKEGSDRVQTVRDKVRRQQVEIEKRPTPPRSST